MRVLSKYPKPERMDSRLRRNDGILQLLLLAVLSALFFTQAQAADPVTLLNVSYDPTRELYQAYNPLFIQYWKTKTGQDVKIVQSHGGSGKQARGVIEGLRADVVTLALAYDIDIIAEKSQLLPANWQSQLPQGSTPYRSTIVFLVREGNPKHIKDWNDLIRDDVAVVTPNPKTSGGARWNYLAAWAWAFKKNNNDEEKAKAYIAELYKHAPVMDTGARGATTTFVERGIGDVLITWENEALMVSKELYPHKFEVIMPSFSILCEPPVAVVRENTDRKNTTEVAQAYLGYLFSPAAQNLIALHYYRTASTTVQEKYRVLFPAIAMAKIEDLGGWKTVQEKHFADGGVFDQIYLK